MPPRSLRPRPLSQRPQLGPHQRNRPVLRSSSSPYKVAAPVNLEQSRSDDGVESCLVLTVGIAEEKEEETREKNEWQRQRPGNGACQNRKRNRATDKGPPGRINADAYHRTYLNHEDARDL